MSRAVKPGTRIDERDSWHTEKEAGISLMKRLLLALLTFGVLACGDISPNGLLYTNQGYPSNPILLLPHTFFGGHVGRGTSYYYAVVSPSTTYTVTVSGLLDDVILVVRKGGFSSTTACTSNTGGSTEECSVSMGATDLSIYIEVINNDTVIGTPYTIQVH